MNSPDDYKVDRTDWPSGPWDGEPDRVEWRSSGYPCLIVRSEFGTLCGYVGLPPGHYLHGAPMEDTLVGALRVHGGITYADRCDGGVTCHAPLPGEPDDVWWLGFDCSHGFIDVSPGVLGVVSRLRPGMNIIFGAGTYRTVEYVRQQVEGLAEQLLAVHEMMAREVGAGRET